MNAAPISSLFQVTPRYLRSTNLERDFRDPQSLENYVLTPHTHECLSRLAKGLRPASTQRAWRLTGNYGSGKSSFALFLAHWFAGEASQLTKSLGVNVKYDQFSVGVRPTYLPLLITGSREPMSKAILRALSSLMAEQYSRGVKSTLLLRIGSLLSQDRVSDREVVAAVCEVNEKLVKDGKGSGLLLLLDELGKFLEFAAYHPESQDVYLLQKLAEAAATSGQTAPLFVIGMLHQGFDAYAETLDPSAQREWEKIAGRFEEVIFAQPLVQISQLIAAALRVNVRALPAFARQEAAAGLEAAVGLGWFGKTPSKRDVSSLAANIYPIHGTVVPALVRAFTRFGQNERSLFSFLLSDEPFSLVNYASRAIVRGVCYRIPNFYDYIRANFGHRLSMKSYRSHWTEIESMVESFATSEPIELAIVKTVGVLNLLDQPDLIATDEAIVACLSGLGGAGEKDIVGAIDRLHKKRRVLFRRGGASGGYCLWPHTSVDLEAAYERAAKTIGAVRSVSAHLDDFLETRPLVARRHYIETGNLRYFDVRYVRVAQLKELADVQTKADGVVAIALCETKSDCDRAEQIAHSSHFQTRKELLVAIPMEPLAHQTGLLLEVLRWEWVGLNTPELRSDRFANEEVSRQSRAARNRLSSRVQDLIGLQSLNSARALRWLSMGKVQKIASSRDLLDRLSCICDDLYQRAPLVKNELLNRQSLSSAASAARMRLIEGILERADQPLLGMDPKKKPPEMSMYLSVLRGGGLHVETPDDWRLTLPETERDALRLLPCLKGIGNYIEQRPDQRIPVSDLLELLASPPFGVREGLAMALLAVYSALNVQELAFYEDGTFLREVTGAEFLRLSKVPGSFELQLCRIAGVRAEIFESLLRVLGLQQSKGHEPLVLDVVKPLCVFVAELPDYVRNTRRLSDESIRVRDTILGAREPVVFLFSDLPVACEVEPFPVDGSLSTERALAFSKKLKKHLDELRDSFDALLARMRSAIREEFNLDGAFDQVRTKLVSRSQPVVVLATEPRVKALCMRLGDTNLGETAWLESLGSLLALQPPARWRDSDEDTFCRELHTLAGRFKALESIAFDRLRTKGFSEAFRFSLTRSDGSEAQQVVFIEKSKVADVVALAGRIEKLIGHNDAIGMAALSKVVWGVLQKE